MLTNRESAVTTTSTTTTIVCSNLKPTSAPEASSSRVSYSPSPLNSSIPQSTSSRPDDDKGISVQSILANASRALDVAKDLAPLLPVPFVGAIFISAKAVVDAAAVRSIPRASDSNFIVKICFRVNGDKPNPSIARKRFTYSRVCFLESPSEQTRLR